MVGLGWSIGSVISGYLWDGLSGHAIFFFSATMAMLAFMVFWLGSNEA
jgi:predicted MFS family arabinose efflux permease